LHLQALHNLNLLELPHISDSQQRTKHSFSRYTHGGNNPSHPQLNPLTNEINDMNHQHLKSLLWMLTGLVLKGSIFTGAAYMLTVSPAYAHAVTEGDKGYIMEIWGIHLIPFTYLGAKHMVTGYDHILFLFGVVFFLYRIKQVALYVTLFALGHSTTMLAGVYFGWNVNAYLIDAIIGLSVVYKALDNLGAYPRWLGFQPNTKLATLIFGLIHGLGLATKILDYEIADDGLLPNLLAFNFGVEIGQLVALSIILIGMGYWRRTDGFLQHSTIANVFLMIAGFWLAAHQLLDYFSITH